MGFMADLKKKRLNEDVHGTDEQIASNFRKHELRSAVNTLRILCELIAKGYRFDDAAAEENIDAMRKAIEDLEVQLLQDRV